jgi:redox-sensing transcriptional repressor
MRKLKSVGLTRIYSSNLADTLGISASLVRKDFLRLKTTGNKKAGYVIDDLLGEIDGILYKDCVRKAIVVGMGKIGTAIVNHLRANGDGIELVAGFDSDPAAVARKFPIPVYSVDKLCDVVSLSNITIGVLCVPGSMAQRLADLMVLAGIKGFLNFAPVRLLLPENCFENNINLALELEKTILYVENIRKCTADCR